MHPAYYHMAHACIMCFDVTRKQTYKNLPAWYKELRDYRAGIPVRASGPVLTHPLIVGTFHTHWAHPHVCTPTSISARATAHAAD